MNDVLIFIISLLVPFVYYRLMFLIYSNYFISRRSLRSITGLKIHHLHHGMFYVLLASIILLLSDKNIYVIILLGFGLGNMLDLLISSLLINTNRNDELKLYKKTLPGTIILFAVLILIIVLLSVLI